MACCLALIDAAVGGATVEPLDILVVMTESFRVGLWPQRPSKTSEMVIAVPDGVILEHELARERRFGIERDRSRLAELFVGERPDGVGRRCTVATEQIKGLAFRDGSILRGVPGIHRVDVVHGHAGYRLPFGNGLGQLDLDRV